MHPLVWLCQMSAVTAYLSLLEGPVCAPPQMAVALQLGWPASIQWLGLYFTLPSGCCKCRTEINRPVHPMGS